MSEIQDYRAAPRGEFSAQGREVDLLQVLPLINKQTGGKKKKKMEGEGGGGEE